MTKQRASIGNDIGDILRGSSTRSDSEAVQTQTSKTGSAQNGKAVNLQDSLPVKQQSSQSFEKATFYLALSDIDLLHEERSRRRKTRRLKQGTDDLSALVRHAIRQTYGNLTSRLQSDFERSQN